MSSLKYRAEVDGLRALAVVPVVLFHAGIPGFSGGYLGVDVFFVISGFLITSILITDLRTGHFSLVEFYERRARRILPALIVMIVACVPFAWLWMLPSELASFGKSIVATVFFVSNILFWRESGYFDPATDLKPLLHTWSLAVEEQYYLLFPVFLYLMYRYARRAIIPALVLLILCSLALAEWGWRNVPAATFYLAPTRIWEILVGAVCVLLTGGRVLHSRFLGLAGLCMIVGSMLGFGADVPVPSLWTAIPVLGTALVLVFATAGTPAAAVLRIRPLVAIGLISYSTYLWHQPLLAFARIRSVAEPSALMIWTLVASAFVLGWLSWKYIEAPFRRRSPRIGRKAIFLGSAGWMTAICIAGLAMVVLDGIPARRAPGGMRYSEIRLLEETLAPNQGLHPTCDSARFLATDLCRSASQPRAILWGDSFAMHLAQALENSPTPLAFAQATYSQCGPIPDLAIQGSITSWQSCMAFNDMVLAWILDQPSIDTVIISSPFRQTERPIHRRDGSIIQDPAQRLAATRESLRLLSAKLSEHGKRLVVISPPAQNGVDLGLCDLRRQAMGGSDKVCDLHYDDYRKFSASMIRTLEAIKDQVAVIWLPELTCMQGICSTSIGDVGIYRDHGHLSVAGSARLGKKFDLAGLVLSAAK